MREVKLRTQERLEVIPGKTLMGLYMVDVTAKNGGLRLTPDEELSVGLRVQDGDLEAFEELVFKNTALVFWIAGAYRWQGQEIGLEYLDLVQEGNLGLMEAARKWRPDLGFRFSSLAFKLIIQKISRAIDKDGPVRLPPKLLQRIRRASRSRHKQNGEDEHKVSEDKTLETYRLMRKPLSLDEAFFLGNETDEKNAYDSFVGLFSEAGLIESEEVKIHEVLRSILTSKQLKAVERRFGFIGGFETLKEIAVDLGVSEQAVWRHLEDAFKRIGKNPYFRDLFRRLSRPDPSSEREKIHELLGQLLSSQRMEIIELRYGFKGEPRTLSEVCEEIGSSYSNVRNQEKAALEKIAQDPYSWEIFKELAKVEPPKENSGPKVNHSAG